nr:hypothetical protein [Arsenophonus endosymbiont of Aleurodicus floccissimus]
MLLVLPDDGQTKSALSAPPLPEEKNTLHTVNNRAMAGLLLILNLLLISRMITQTPFSFYVTSLFSAPKWLVGLAYGLQATGVIVSTTF